MATNEGISKLVTKPIGFIKRVFKPKYIVLLAIIGLAFGIRAMNTKNQYLTGLDPYFQLRIAEYIADNGFFTSRPEIDTLSWHSPVEPYGKQLLHPPFLHYAIAFFGILIGDVHLVAKWYPAIAACITILIVYKIMSEAFDEATGIGSAFLLAIYGPYVNRTTVAFGDTDALEMLLIFLIAWAVTRTNNNRTRDFLFLGLALALLGLSWYGYIIIAAVIVFYTLIRYHFYFGISIYLIVLGIFNFWLPQGPEALGIFLVISGALIPPAFIFFRYKHYRLSVGWDFVIKTNITIFISIFVVYLIDPSTLGLGIDVGPTQSFVGPTNSELQTQNIEYYLRDIFYDQIGANWELNVLNSGVLKFMLLMLGLAVVLLSFSRTEDMKSIEILGIMVGLLSFVGLTQGHRFMYFTTVPFVIFGGIAVGWIYNTYIEKAISTRKPDIDSVAASTFLFVGAIGLLINATYWSAQFGASSGWIAAFDWMKENTDENEVIASWWDYGYWTETLANRPVVMDNGHYWGGYRPCNLRFFDMSASYCTTSEYEAVSRLHNYNASYFMISDRDADIWGALWYYFTYAGEPHEDLSVSPAYFWKMPTSQTRYSIQRIAGENRNYTLKLYLWGPQNFGEKTLYIIVYIVHDETNNEYFPYAMLSESPHPINSWYDIRYFPKNIYTFEEVWYGNKTYYMSNYTINYPYYDPNPTHTIFSAVVSTEEDPDALIDLGSLYGIRTVSWADELFYKELEWSFYIREDEKQFIVMFGNPNYKAKDSVYAQLFFKDGKNLEYFEKVYGNSEVKIFKIKYPEEFVDEW